MPADTIPVPVPHILYERLERLAVLSGRSLESLVAQTLATSLPTIPEQLSETTQAALRALEQYSDSDLWNLVRWMASDEQVEALATLRAHQRDGVLTREEADQLAILQSTLDLFVLQKAYAAVILKWRGQRIPSLAELAA